MNYRKLYLLLFSATAKAVRQIEEQNYGSAKLILVEAQQQAQGEKAAAADGGQSPGG